MIGLRIVPLAGAAPVPWRNGGGVTRELLAWPAGDDWCFRISVAHIDRDGPFSALPGVERWFAVVAGAGVRLRFDDGERTLTPRSPPLRFDGAAAPGCTRVDGPTDDLNLMLRAGAGSATMQRAQSGSDWTAGAALRALYCHGAAQLAVDGRPAAELEAPALVWHPNAAGQRWRLNTARADTPAWRLAFTPNDTR